MEWHQNSQGTYILTQGSCRAYVRLLPVGKWEGEVGFSSVAYTQAFSTLENAQAWCLAELTKIASRGDCKG